MRLQAIICLLLQLTFEPSSSTVVQVIPGAILELPCFSFEISFSGSPITWKFNGKNISDESPGPTGVKKNGLNLAISPVTAAHEGQYTCLVVENDMEMIRTYDIKVVASNIFTIKIPEGSNVHLPCYFPPSSQVTANALWKKETNSGTSMWLNPRDSSTSSQGRRELLFPLDHDQTVLLRDTVMGDAGTYHCESAGGHKMSTVFLIIEVAPTPVPHSCRGFTAAWEPCLDENSRTAGPLLQESMAEFSMKAFSYLGESQPSGNLLFSPTSIGGALSHLLLGARDNTRRALERAMCVPHDFHCVHFQMKKLREKLSGSLQMASQIYYNPQMNLSESFTSQSIGFYDAEPLKLLGTSEGSADMINSWVANKTGDKIKHLVDSVSPNTMLMLLNAVSFSGQWTVKFDPKPKKGHFTKLNGDMVKVPLLHHQKYPTAMGFVVDLKAQVARFALTGNSSLYILLPRFNTPTDLRQLEARLTDNAVLLMVEQMQTTPPQTIEVSLPKIKLDVEADMNLLIKKLGLSSLFEDPNLCGLYPEEKLVLDDAKHRAFLALTEQGVEAGAATSLSFSRSQPAFSALRPFVMLLWSDAANVPLFIGRVTDP